MTEQQLKKGLFRLWIFVSVCWVCFAIYGLSAEQQFEFLFFGLYIVYDVQEGTLADDLFDIIAPPVILLILGKSIFWIVKGFKKSD